MVKDRLECRVNFSARVGLDTFAKEYALGNFSTHLHFIVRGNPFKHFDGNEFCAVFHRHPKFRMQSGVEFHYTGGTSRTIVREENTNLPSRVWAVNNGGVYNWKQAMFIGVVQLVKQPQGITEGIIPSMIWLQPLNKCLLGGRKVHDASRPAFVIERSLGEDGKLRLVIRDGNLSQSKLPYHEVKATPQIMGNLTDCNGPLQGRRFQNLDPEHYLSGLVVDLGNDGTTVRIVEPLDGIIQGIEMFNCPTELEATTIERMHMLLPT